MSKGYVYVLTNDAMPGLVKVGKTTRAVQSRAEELFQTGVPYPFRVFFEALAPDCSEIERWVHEALDGLRVNQSREFFRADPAFAAQKIRDAVQEQVEAWLGEFMPGQILVDELAFIDPCDLHILADELDVAVYEVAGAVGELTAEELNPALQRYLAKHGRHLRVVGK